MPGRTGAQRCVPPTHQLSVHVLHVCHVLLKFAPFMHCVHHHSAKGLHFSAVHLVYVLIWLCIRPHSCMHFAPPPIVLLHCPHLCSFCSINSVFGGFAMASL